MKYDAVRRVIFPLVEKVARCIDLSYDNSVHERLALEMIQSPMMGELLGIMGSRSTFEDDRFFRKHYGSAYAWTARQIVRYGMATAKKQAIKDEQIGLISPAELQRRLLIYAEVAA